MFTFLFPGTPGIRPQILASWIVPPVAPQVSDCPDRKPVVYNGTHSPPHISPVASPPVAPQCPETTAYGADAHFRTSHRLFVGSFGCQSMSKIQSWRSLKRPGGRCRRLGKSFPGDQTLVQIGPGRSGIRPQILFHPVEIYRHKFSASGMRRLLVFEPFFLPDVFPNSDSSV